MNKVIRYNLLVAAALLLFVGCLRDSFDDCPRPLRVTVRAFDADQRDITSLEYVEVAYLFVFDQDEQFIRAYRLNAEQIMGRAYVPIVFEPDHAPESLIFDVWGNVCDLVDFTHRNAIPVARRGDKRLTLNRAAVQQAATTLSANRDVALSPGDLFHGTLSAPIQFGDVTVGTTEHVVDIFRKTAQVHIITKGLREFNDNREGTYRYEVHGGVDAINYAGAFAGELVRKRPAAIFNAEGQFVTAQAFRKLATQHASPAHQGETVSVDIFFNNTLLYSANEDSDGNPFVAHLGRTLNIVIVLDPDGERVLSIRTIITPWDEIHQEANVGGGAPRPICPICNERPCICEPEPCPICEEYPCVCEPGNGNGNGNGNGGDIVPGDYVLLAGVRWAVSNVALPGQFAPVGDRGMMFQWGSNTAWEPGGTLISHNPSGLTAWPGNAALSGVNNDWYGGVGPCPTGWRLPTVEEFEALILEVNPIHIGTATVGDVEVQVVRAVDGFMTFGTPAVLSFPLTGRRNAAGWGMDEMGFYFAYPAPAAGTMMRLQFNSPAGGAGTLHLNAMERVHGQFVRCVRIN